MVAPSLGLNNHYTVFVPLLRLLYAGCAKQLENLGFENSLYLYYLYSQNISHVRDDSFRIKGWKALVFFSPKAHIRMWWDLSVGGGLLWRTFWYQILAFHASKQFLAISFYFCCTWVTWSSFKYKLFYYLRRGAKWNAVTIFKILEKESRDL